MKKIYALLLILVGITSNSFALSGGPDAYGYTWRDINDPNGPVYNWIDIAGITGAVDVKPLGDDNTVGALQIGFPFHFYWYDVTQVWVGSNGFIAFGNDNLASPFYTIPSTTQPNNFVAAMLSDLNFDGVGNLAQCWLWRSPTNDTCIISWINVPFWQVNAPYYTGSNTFQIILNNNDSSITFQYQQQSGLSSGAVSNYMTVGIENISGSVGLQVLHDPLNLGGYYLTTPYAIKFYYPPSTTYIANDAEAHWTGNAISGGIFLSRNSPTPYQMVAAIKNTGNINTSPFNTNCKILNSVNTTVVQDNATVSLLTPAQVQVLTMSNTFNPTTSGTYKMITTTSLAGDSVPSNNIDSLEIVVVDTSQLNIRLSYDDNTANGPGLNWNGGNGGAGVQFVPPFFPCRVKQLHFYIVSNASNVGFAAKLYESGGPNGLPGNMLDSVWVPATSVVAGTWNNVILSAPIMIDSGGFFVEWQMGGANIILGENISKPISNRTFEVLTNHTWAIYRFRQTNDLMINATIDRDPNTAVEPANFLSNESYVYPNPASKELRIKNAELKIEVVEIYNSLGEMVYSSIPQSHELTVDVSQFETGMYLCRIKAGEAIITRKISVVR